MARKGDIFSAFDLSGIPDRPGELGAFSIESLYVRYDFTYQEFVDSFALLPPKVELPEPLKTVTHETTHLFHTLTTPFGFLIYALRRVQAFLVQNAINDLRRNYGLTVRLPLMKFARGLPESIRKDTEHYFGMWFECELFILFALDGFEAWNQQVLKNPYLTGLGPSDLFSRTQRWIARLYRDHERAVRREFKRPPDEATLPFGDYRADKLGGKSNRSTDFYVLTQSTFLDDLNMIFVTESAGTIAESFGSSGRASDVWDRFRKTFDRRGIGNMFGVRLMESSMKASSASEFVLSYLALSELALFGPVLPQHRAFRAGKHADLWELMPFLRWQRLVGAAGKIRPMRGMEDHERYVGELCQALGWIDPTTLTRFTADRHVSMENDTVEAIYVAASGYRRADPTVFLDYGWVLTGDGPEHARFLSLFNFPVVQYRDRTLYHRDKELLLGLTRWHLLRVALRTILLRDRVEIQMPYRPKDDEEVAFMRQTLIDDLQQAIGIRVDRLTLT